MNKKYTRVDTRDNPFLEVAYRHFSARESDLFREKDEAERTLNKAKLAYEAAQNKVEEAKKAQRDFNREFTLKVLEIVEGKAAPKWNDPGEMFCYSDYPYLECVVRPEASEVPAPASEKVGTSGTS